MVQFWGTSSLQGAQNSSRCTAYIVLMLEYPRILIVVLNFWCCYPLFFVYPPGFVVYYEFDTFMQAPLNQLGFGCRDLRLQVVTHRLLWWWEFSGWLQKKTPLLYNATVLSCYYMACYTTVCDIMWLSAASQLSQWLIANSDQVYENSTSYAKNSCRHAYIIKIWCCYIIFSPQSSILCQNVMHWSDFCLGSMSP